MQKKEEKFNYIGKLVEKEIPIGEIYETVSSFEFTQNLKRSRAIFRTVFFLIVQYLIVQRFSVSYTTVNLLCNYHKSRDGHVNAGSSSQTNTYHKIYVNNYFANHEKAPFANVNAVGSIIIWFLYLRSGHLPRRNYQCEN